MNRSRSRSSTKRLFARGKRRAGFTLIELLAVILIISILAVALVPMVTDAVEQASVTACQANLSNVYKGIIIYRTKYKRLPSQSGVRFFAELYSKQAMEQTKTNAERLTCPAVDVGALEIGGIPWAEWWEDLENVTGDYSAYAGRDCKRFPLRKLTGKDPLVGDDNDPEMNHSTTTNVLYGDGAVNTFEVELLRDEGLLMDDEPLYVGLESQVDDLQKLSLN
jgi:prepilin-type N-terminal cleavage/methylation domain-containing protein